MLDLILSFEFEKLREIYFSRLLNNSTAFAAVFVSPYLEIISSQHCFALATSPLDLKSCASFSLAAAAVSSACFALSADG